MLLLLSRSSAMQPTRRPQRRGRDEAPSAAPRRQRTEAATDPAAPGLRPKIKVKHMLVLDATHRARCAVTMYAALLTQHAMALPTPGLLVFVMTSCGAREVCPSYKQSADFALLLQSAPVSLSRITIGIPQHVDAIARCCLGTGLHNVVGCVSRLSLSPVYPVCDDVHRTQQLVLLLRAMPSLTDLSFVVAADFSPAGFSPEKQQAVFNLSVALSAMKRLRSLRIHVSAVRAQSMAAIAVHGALLKTVGRGLRLLCAVGLESTAVAAVVERAAGTLRRLTLRHVAMLPQLATAVRDASQLTELSATGSCLNREAAAPFFRSLQGKDRPLIHLNVSGSDLTDAVADVSVVLQRLPHLRTLVMQECAVRDADLALLAAGLTHPPRRLTSVIVHTIDEPAAGAAALRGCADSTTFYVRQR
jgi:hypothetical protein